MLYEKQITLDSRLAMLAEMVGRCKAYADVGCDHGRLGAFLVQKKWVDRAILTDISEPSLEKARGLVRLLGLEARVRFAVGDGLEALDEPVDAVVIAGMGGTTAAGIIERGREQLGDARLILQANVALPELRQRLCGAGYAIVNERLAKDGRRFYVAIEARPGRAHYDARQLMVGPVLLEKRPPELEGYAQFRFRVAQKALSGAEHGADAALTEALREEKCIWEELIACL